MYFLNTLFNFIGKIHYIFNSTILNTKLISNYLFNEIMFLKFIFDAYFFKKSNLDETKSLLAFFKKNCFFRDYIYFWQKWSFNRDQSSINLPLNTNLFIQKNINFLEILSLSKNMYSKNILNKINTSIFLKKLFHEIESILHRSFSFGFFYLQGFAFILFIDACLTDDEPLWEPIEWSLIQTWILFIFSFAWIAENLIVSRFGSYTGRDKRVWFSWYKSFWLIEGYYAINYGVACIFVIVPFYFEINYNLSFVYSWWHWYSRVFFFKFISLFTIILFLSYYLQIGMRWLNWKKGLVIVLSINIFLAYLIYTQFIITFFGYFTDPIWYQKTRPIDYIQLSHEPSRWGWGSAKKDHFTYHNVKTVLWFKNDGPFASSFLFFQTYLFVCIFMLYIYWITLFRRIYSMKEIPLTYTTYCVSSLKQFFYFFLMFYVMIFCSYIFNYSRFPIEFLWTIDTLSWSNNFFNILLDYPDFLLSIVL